MEIADEVLKLGIDLVALQESRWQGLGEFSKKDCTVIYSGPENRTGQYGTGFVISQQKLKKMFWNVNQLMIDYADLELAGD